MPMPGSFYRSHDGVSSFEAGPTIFEPEMRHAALLVRGDELLVFWTRVGDCPERILLSTVPLTDDWMDWRESETVEVMRAERPWEGADAPVEPSVRSAVDHPVNQLRDPAIYAERDEIHLVYAVAGESGLGIARLAIGR